jgi:hypothetical protein
MFELGQSVVLHRSNGFTSTTFAGQVVEIYETTMLVEWDKGNIIAHLDGSIPSWGASSFVV